MSAIIQINLEEHLGKVDDKTLINTVVERSGKEEVVNLIADAMELSIGQVDILKTFLKGLNQF